ncbi:MAG TPA: sigma-70 family RNA polymerase sigma factor [Candidatus Eremiobacteraceae bacterium]|nr:sigma-70 family RNA polymerase sigma factor [Candidatus Eremiobacteraceae bacterium]
MSKRLDGMPLPDDGPALEGLWIAQIARGDRAAFERLYGAYQRPLFRYFLHFVHVVELAEELTDDVLVEVWKNAARFHGRSKPSVWVFGIAYHKAMDALRRRRPPVVDLHAVENAPDDQRLAPEAAALHESVRNDVALALATLSAEHRAVLVLTFGHGYGYAEIAQIVGCPVNTVKTRMFYAKKRLKETLERRGVRADVS